MFLDPSRPLFSFPRATRAEGGRAVGEGMHGGLGLATGNGLTLATIGGGNVASIQCCQFPMVPMGNDCAEDDGTTRRRDGGFSTIRRKRKRGTSVWVGGSENNHGRSRTGFANARPDGGFSTILPPRYPAEGGRTVGGRMQWELGLATGNSLTLATIGGGNVASIQRCQFPMVPMGNDCAEETGRRGDGTTTFPPSNASVNAFE